LAKTKHMPCLNTGENVKEGSRGNGEKGKAPRKGVQRGKNRPSHNCEKLESFELGEGQKARKGNGRG